jgi:hypothetical protein
LVTGVHRAIAARLVKDSTQQLVPAIAGPHSLSATPSLGFHSIGIN